MTLRCAVNPHVGNPMFPVKQRLALRFKAHVGLAGESIVLDILYP